MEVLDLFLNQEESEYPDIYSWFRGGPSHWDNIVSFTEDVYETAGEFFEYGYLTARVAFAAPFIFAAAGLFTITDYLLALIESDYVY